MIINNGNLGGLFTGFKTAFNKGLSQAPSHYKDIAMTVPSQAREATYAWLGQFPKLREWLGDRETKSLVANGYTIKDKLYENTLSVPRTDIEDDVYGIFAPLFSEMGRVSGEHPDELIFDLLAAGFASPCYDGQSFFDADHPVKGSSVSNMQAGSQPA
jgi:phage major head subunit gpT-like protein